MRGFSCICIGSMPKKVAVLTSGGDAPGMNAAIRAVVRTGLDNGWEMHGIRRGFAGLIAGDTALDIALESIDRLRTTASSHRRAFLVEVMGRDCGYLALMAGIAGGAEAIVIPEREMEPTVIGEQIRSANERGKTHSLVVVA